jgi:hypothetical protein
LAAEWIADESLADVDHGDDDVHQRDVCRDAHRDGGAYPSLVDLFRSDIREGKRGTLLTLTIRVVDVASGCSAVCSAGFRRPTRAAKSRSRRSIQAGATPMHVEVTVGGRSVKVTQIAFPETVRNTVHASGTYASRGSNPTSNASDGIFADSLSSEIVTPTGSVSSGHAATFQVGISM